MTTENEIRSWAATSGLDPAIGYCVGAKFVRDYGRLPWGTDELCPWATEHGYRSAEGFWSCSLDSATEAPPLEWVEITHWMELHPALTMLAVLGLMALMAGFPKRVRYH